MTLVVTYVEGGTLKVPYFDYHSAMSFLSLEEDVTGYEVVPYTGA